MMISSYKKGLSWLAAVIVGPGGLTVQGPLALGVQSLVASTTQTQAGALTRQITGPIVIVNAVNANDAVALPTAIHGALVRVITASSPATPAIWPATATDAIDAGAAGMAVTLSAAHRGADFVCDSDGHWTSSLFGAVAS